MERLTRFHLFGWMAVASVLSVAGVCGSLDPQVKLQGGDTVASWKTPSQAIVEGVSGGMGPIKILFPLMAIGAFAQAIKTSYVVEKDEQIESAVQAHEEQAAFAEHRASLQAQINKRQMEQAAEVDAHQVIAETKGMAYFAKEMGLPPESVEAAFVEVEPEPAKPAETKDTPAPVVEKIVESTIVNTATCRILDELVVSSRSTVLAAPTGTGKSVSESYWLTKFMDKYPDGEIWVICQKNDSFHGLREKGRVKIFDPLDPMTAFEALDQVYAIFDKRRKSKEDDRSSYKNKPVRLILADWHSIYDSIKGFSYTEEPDDPKAKKGKQVKPFQQSIRPRLSTLVTVGRELNVCLFADTQSYNIASLGLTEDANIRSNLNVVCQGYSWTDEDGMIHGDYAMIGNLLRNRYLVNQDSAEELIAKLGSIQQESQRTRTPVIFTSVGQPRLELLPDLKSYKPGLA